MTNQDEIKNLIEGFIQDFECGYLDSKKIFREALNRLVKEALSLAEKQKDQNVDEWRKDLDLNRIREERDKLVLNHWKEESKQKDREIQSLKDEIERIEKEVTLIYAKKSFMDYNDFKKVINSG